MRVRASSGTGVSVSVDQVRMHLVHGPGHRVTITGIVATTVDTSVGDVHEAAARATWGAVGVDPAPPYRGFSEPELVRRWIRDQRGRTIQGVTEAWHWYHGAPTGLLHVWLGFRGMPTLLHEIYELLLRAEEPYASYTMAEHGEARVGPANDVLGAAVGQPLVDGGAIVFQLADEPPTCAGLLLQFPDRTVVIGSLADEFVVTSDARPEYLNPYWKTLTAYS